MPNHDFRHHGMILIKHTHKRTHTYTHVYKEKDKSLRGTLFLSLSTLCCYVIIWTKQETPVAFSDFALERTLIIIVGRRSEQTVVWSSRERGKTNEENTTQQSSFIP